MKHNTNNVKVKPKVVSEYARQMKAGLWRFNGETIVFADDGVMLDGQHRLLAVIESGVSADFLVVKGIPNRETAMNTIDIGKIRKASDVFDLNDIPESVNASAIISAYCRLKSGRFFVKGYVDCKVSKQELAEIYFSDSKLFYEIVRNAGNCYRYEHLLPISLIGGFMAYLIKEKHYPKELVYGFFEQVCSGKEIKNNTIYLLRSRLIRGKDGSDRLSETYRLVFLIKTWNYFVRGKELKCLKYNKEDEGVPEIR